MKALSKAFPAVLCILLLTAALTGCSGSDKRIIRIGHNQATDHPTNIALLAFEEYVESELGDRYDVEVYPSELLGSQTDMVQLTQTGAIDFCVASNSILETFSKNYTLFNLPYLFVSSEAYHDAMDDPAITEPIFESTKQAGFEAVTWIDAGTRNFYTVGYPHRVSSRSEGTEDPRPAVPHQRHHDEPAGRLRHPHGLWRGVHRPPVQGH